MLELVATGIPWELDRADELVDLHIDLSMRTLRSVAELRAALDPARHAGRVIGLVPTMGALHEGHLALIARARAECDVVVVSLFVNPAQFNESADMARYPRDERRDRRLAQEAGGDLLFAPTVEEVYPAGFSTSVEVLGLTDRLEGAVRGSAHFMGVTTVVTKLLNMVSPDVAYFGQKDAQQLAVIRRLAQDLNLQVRIEACPTVRESDGLAMSSRNAHLSHDERARALALHAALHAAATEASKGKTSTEELLRAARAAMAPFDVEPEYLALVSPDTIEPVARLEAPTLLAVAARVGATRLIDNVVLHPVVVSDSKPGALQVTHQADPAAGQARQANPKPVTAQVTGQTDPKLAARQTAGQTNSKLAADQAAEQADPQSTDPADDPNPLTPTPTEAQATCSA
jgi:pantoate--beta-alanine ligase